MRKARTRLWSVLLTCAMLLALLPTAALATETDTAENDWFVMQDFGEWGKDCPIMSRSVAIPEEFDTTNIIAIEVGLKDAAGQLIVKYTADTKTIVQSSEYNSDGKNQIAFQAANGYINSNRQSSAPFYQSIAIAEDGKLMAEVKGEDWTVIHGGANVFFAWEPTTAYVKVTTEDGTQEKENESFTGSVSSAYVAKVDDKYYSTLEDAFTAVAQSEDKTVTLTAGVVVSDAGHMGGYGTAIINVPAGVTLDGAGYSIIAQNWTSENQYHIIGVSETDADTTTTIQNLTIAGNANTKSGIHAYKCKGTVAISGATIMGCGNAAVQVNGSIVTAKNLTTSGNAWGAVNVDKGSNVTTETSFTLSGNENSLSEPVKVWTELTDTETIITVPESWAQGQRAAAAMPMLPLNL